MDELINSLFAILLWMGAIFLTGLIWNVFKYKKNFKFYDEPSLMYATGIFVGSGIALGMKLINFIF